jgi:hypothetical protein
MVSDVTLAIKYCIIMRKLHSGAVVRAELVWVRTRVRSYNMLDFFLLIYFVKKMLVNIIILILFTVISKLKNFLIFKQKKFFPRTRFEPGSLLNLIRHGTLYLIGWHPKTCCLHHKTCCYHHFCF